MTQSQLQYGGKAIADNYERCLVPVIFDPWAEMLIDHLPPTEGAAVLDLATGTGIVAQKLAERVGPQGRVAAVDPSPWMLSHAKARCRHAPCPVDCVEGTAESMQIGDGTIDFLYCQQGLQFFTDYKAAVREMGRVLKPGARLALSTWLPVSRCHFFDALCDALLEVGLPHVSQKVADSFAPMPEEELEQLFLQAGFTNVELTRQSRSMRIEGGIEQAFETILGTLAGPAVQELQEREFIRFMDCVVRRLKLLRGCDGVTYGSLAASVLTAAAPR